MDDGTEIFGEGQDWGSYGDDLYSEICGFLVALGIKDGTDVCKLAHLRVIRNIYSDVIISAVDFEWEMKNENPGSTLFEELAREIGRRILTKEDKEAGIKFYFIGTEPCFEGKNKNLVEQCRARFYRRWDEK
jgi:hypothetical protein